MSVVFVSFDNSAVMVSLPSRFENLCDLSAYTLWLGQKVNHWQSF